MLRAGEKERMGRGAAAVDSHGVKEDAELARMVRLLLDWDRTAITIKDLQWTGSSDSSMWDPERRCEGKKPSRTKSERKREGKAGRRRLAGVRARATG